MRPWSGRGRVRENVSRSMRSSWIRGGAVVVAALLAGACAGDEEGNGDGGDEPAEVADVPEGAIAADDSLPPVTIGLIAQEDELVAFPEVRQVAETMIDYFNAELGGIGGHPAVLDVCTAGDTPESAVTCAQQFVNNDDVHFVIQGTLSTEATNPILAEAGKVGTTQGNGVPDYVTPGIFNLDPGVLGFAQSIIGFLGENLGVTNTTVFYADDPFFEGFLPVIQALADAAGLTVNEFIPLGAEADLTGPISAGIDDDTESVAFLVDSSRCGPAGDAVQTLGLEVEIVGTDLCLTDEVVASGSVDGWYGPQQSLAATTNGGADVDEIIRIFDTYGDDTPRAGLAGWTIANMTVARDVLEAAGAAGATDESVVAAMSSYSSSEILGYPEVSCPGPGSFVGACNTHPLIVQVVDGALQDVDGFLDVDFSLFEPLLEG